MAQHQFDHIRNHETKHKCYSISSSSLAAAWFKYIDRIGSERDSHLSHLMFFLLSLNWLQINST